MRAYTDCSTAIVVDDDTLAGWADEYAYFLIRHGCEVSTHYDPYSALSAYRLDIELVVTDVGMPGMDGFEMIRRMRKISH